MEAAQQQRVALGSLSTGVSAPEVTPFVQSPVAASEPPIRNMSVSTASTTGSIELPLHRSPSAPHVQHEPGADVSAQGPSSTFMGTQVWPGRDTFARCAPRCHAGQHMWQNWVSVCAPCIHPGLPGTSSVAVAERSLQLFLFRGLCISVA